MRTPYIIICFFLLPFSSRAAEAVDPTLLEGLKVFEANGVDAATLVWYPDQPDVAGQVRSQLLEATKNLGQVVGTEVVSIQTVSKRLTRYFVAVYFTRTPLWIRIDRYATRDRAFFFPLKFSPNADQILPAYITDFQH